jgi:hypothetical protein
MAQTELTAMKSTTGNGRGNEYLSDFENCIFIQLLARLQMVLDKSGL